MSEVASHQVFERIDALLKSHGIEFRVLSHAAAFTSAESATARGVSLHAGAKALIVKADGTTYSMIVIPADFSLDTRGAKSHLGVKDLRFASKEEVATLTGLTPGSIPPFGSIFGLETHCDTRIHDNELIFFNAGSHTQSIGMKPADYVRAENPVVGQFGKPGDKA